MLIDAAATPWQAMTAKPWRFLASSWPWRSLGYVACGAVAAVPVLVLTKVLEAFGSGWAVAATVCVVVLACLLAAVPVGRLERRRLRIVDHDAHRLPHGHAPVPSGARWWRVRLAERATWREFGYVLLLTSVVSVVNAVIVVAVLALLLAPVGLVLVVLFDGDGSDYSGAGNLGSAAVIVLVWVVLAPVSAYVTTAVAGAQAALARLLLTDRSAPLAAQVRELTRSRTRLVDAFEAERSRIERDLHDGAQQRLVALTMSLGMAELTLSEEGSEAAPLVGRARREAEAVLGELRELIRGIHPQVLTDRGIEAAVTEITDRCPIPVAVRVDLPGRPARTVESIAYFAVSEALTNVVKHAGAARAEVVATAVGDRLVLTVTDSGIGGADPAGGTGLQGLADRVAVVGGTLCLTSPLGGPTELRVELPWRTTDCG